MKDNANSQVAEPACAPFQTEPRPTHRILVVDDEPLICRLNTAVLSNYGYLVDAVEDGAAAWEALCADNYDLMITDNSMPKLTGVELLKMLRAAHMELPVIMATGTMPKEEFTRYPWLKPAAILLKPYTVEDLLGTVRTVLRATVSDPGQFEPPPDWQSQPSAIGLRL